MRSAPVPPPSLPRRAPRWPRRKSRAALPWRTALPLLAALALASPQQPLPGQGEAAGGAAPWIERLGSGVAREREEAQRWLAAHLSAGDLPELARALRGGDPEVQRRLADALAADERRLGLAAVLAADARPELRAAGESALSQMLGAWSPRSAEPPLPRAKLVGGLAATRALRLLRLEAGEEPPAELLWRLDRLGGLGVPLALDPALLELGPRRYRGATGDALELLGATLEAFELELEGLGFDERGEPAQGSWIHVTRRGLEGLATGRELLLSAVRSVELGGAEAPAAARLLAASGWPAALAWLGERWMRSGDGGALDALLAAAARGRVAPVLATPRGQERALARADAALAAGRPGWAALVERTARGLAGLGSLGPGGEDLDRALLDTGPAALASLAPAALWMRLVALEGRAGGDRGHAVVLARLLEERGLAPALRLQAARALAARASAAVPAGGVPAGLDELVDLALRGDLAGELARVAGQLGWKPPEVPGGDPRRALLVADWSFAAGDAPAAVAGLAAAAPALEGSPAQREAAVRVLAGWVAREGAGATAALLEPSLEAEPAGGPLARLALRAGALSAPRQAELHGALTGMALDPGAFELLGHLAAGHGGATARRILLEQLEPGAAVADPDLLAAGLSAAAVALARARQDEQLARFMEDVWKRLAANRAHPLARRLAPPHWPPRAGLARDSLTELDRRLGELAPP